MKKKGVEIKTIKIAPKRDGSIFEIPYIIIRGKEKGSKLLAEAGIHGNEFEGVEAILRLAETLNPNELKGEITLVPVVNVPAFERVTRSNTIDNIDLNRCFPGKSNGTISERLAYQYFKEGISKTNYLLDFHSGGIGFIVGPHIVFSEVGNKKVDEATLNLAKSFGLKYLCKSPYAGMVNTEACKQGIPSIASEVSGEGKCDESYVKIDMNGFNNILKYLNMIEGEVDLLNKWIIVEGSWIRSKKGGYLRPEIKRGQYVSEGEVLGRIINLKVIEIECIKAKYDGIVLGIRTCPSIYPGDWTFWIAKILEEI